MNALAWQQHLILLPIIVPLLTGALLVPVNEKHHQRKYVANLLSTLTVLGCALALLYLTDAEHWPSGIGVYLAANWSAPYGIALVADRLAALMLTLTAVLALAALVFSSSRWSRIGVHFHSLFQFLLMGLNGAFLTNDLFNLFVFFEVMLAASYGLVLHGYNVNRIRAGMQYITVNLMASFLFLIGVALIYAVAGTLNISDLGARVVAMDAAELRLLKVGAGILALAFLTKSAMWPLGFWLPTTYAAASPPVAAMLVLMTKVGVYALLRVWLQVFAVDSGPLAGFGFTALFCGGLLTLLFGAVGLLASDEPGHIAGYAAIVSSGTLLAVIGYGQSSLISAGLLYLLGSTIATAAFMLLIEFIERIRTPGASLLAVTMEAFAIDEKPEEPVGVGIPGTLAFLGLAFACCALVITGLPPLSGFIAKFSLLHSLLNPESGVPDLNTWLLMGLIIVAGLAGIISLMRFGVRTFWAAGSVVPPRLQLSELLPVAALLLLCIGLTVMAGPVSDYLRRVAADLNQPGHYVERVLGEPAIPGPVRTQEGSR